MTDDALPRALDTYRAHVEQAVLRALPRVHDPLAPMLRYHLGIGPGPDGTPPGSGGKRWRGTLCLLACQAVRGDTAPASAVAAAVELVHAFTLLHDDIADQDAVRRGRPTVWKLWGVGQALTAGDAMFALANVVLSELPPELARELSHGLNEAVLAVCAGQSQDLAFEGQRDVRVEDYLGMIALKTGALFAAATGLGAQAGGGAPEQVEALTAFGAHLGLAFQIEDDLLGLWGEAEAVGKPVGSDLQRNKRSLPILYALALDHPVQARVAAALARGPVSAAEAAALARDMEAAGVRRYGEEMAAREARAACKQLAHASLHPGPVETLRRLAEQSVTRRQ